MGWIVDGADEHEGWVANVLEDGRVASASTGGGVIIAPVTPLDEACGYEIRRYPGSELVEVVVPWDQVALWRVSCQCGWTGRERAAVADAKYSSRACPEDLEDRVFVPEWRAHVAPYAALFELGELTEQLHTLEGQVEEKVQMARTAGASWAQIGRQAGLSKQGAQQRWGHLTPA